MVLGRRLADLVRGISSFTRLNYGMLNPPYSLKNVNAATVVILSALFDGTVS
jgi:hypothetical protein